MSFESKTSPAKSLKVPIPKCPVTSIQKFISSWSQVFNCHFSLMRNYCASFSRNTSLDKSSLLFSSIEMLLKLYRRQRMSCRLVSPLWGFRKVSSHSEAWFTEMRTEIVLLPLERSMHTKPEEQVPYTVQLPAGCT